MYTRDTNSESGADNDPLIVRTKNGRVRGLTQSAANGKRVDTWYGIPYAKKPIGNE